MTQGVKTLIKIDAEGAETRILRGLEHVISSWKPDLIVEVLKPYEDELNSLGFLSKTGYEMFNITEGGLVKKSRFEAGRFYDFFLAPRSEEG